MSEFKEWIISILVWSIIIFIPAFLFSMIYNVFAYKPLIYVNSFIWCYIVLFVVGIIFQVREDYVDWRDKNED